MSYTREQFEEVIRDLKLICHPRNKGIVTKNTTYEFTDETVDYMIDEKFSKLPETGLVVHIKGAIVMRTGFESGYGFEQHGRYETEKDNSGWTFGRGFSSWRSATEADEKRWEELLIEEAKRRYKVGDKVRTLANSEFVIDVVYHKETYECYLKQDNQVWGGTKKDKIGCRMGILLFKEGKWAEIIEEPYLTDEEVHKSLKKLADHLGYNLEKK